MHITIEGYLALEIREIGACQNKASVNRIFDQIIPWRGVENYPIIRMRLTLRRKAKYRVIPRARAPDEYR